MQDHFASPYVGKVYNDRATEVVSTGMEYLINPKSLTRLFLDDAEQFLLTLGVLQ